MFGISPLGWVHTLGSLPAIPLALYMLVRHGRIRPRSLSGRFYFASMLVGAVTVFLVAHQPISKGIAVVTLACLALGFTAGRIRGLGRAALYLETVCLSVSVFLLMVPTVSETLRRVPDGKPFVTDLKSPVLLGAQGLLLLILMVGLAAQLIYLRKRVRAGVGVSPA